MSISTEISSSPSNGLSNPPFIRALQSRGFALLCSYLHGALFCHGSRLKKQKNDGQYLSILELCCTGNPFSSPLHARHRRDQNCMEFQNPILPSA